MLWHCGVLSSGLNPDENLRDYRRYNWHFLPEPLLSELTLWLAMPGFSISFHSEMFEKDRATIKRFKGDFDIHADTIIENWLSATREDCIKLAHKRPENGGIPVLTKLQIRRDICRRYRQSALAELYGVRPSTINRLAWGLPDEIETLPIQIIELLAQDPALGWSAPPKMPERFVERGTLSRALG